MQAWPKQAFMCGLAFTVPMLLCARVMQGVVGAPMIQLSQSIITGLGLLVPGVWELHEEHPLADLRRFFLPLTVINVSGLAPAPMASAAGLGNFIRITGSSVGIAVRAARGRALTGATPINLAVA